MTIILPIGPLEWEKVTEMHVVKFPRRDTDSLRRKYTSTHRRKVPTGDPNCPPEVREAKRVKVAIGNKAELADCTAEYDMEGDSDELESDSVVARVHNVGVSSDTELSLSPHRGGLRVRGRKVEKPDLMGILVMQMTNDAAAREEARKERAEDRKKAEEDRREAAKNKAEEAKEKAADRRDFTMMIASIAGGYFGLERKKKRSRDKRRRHHGKNDNDDSSSSSNSADSGEGMDSPIVEKDSKRRSV